MSIFFEVNNIPQNVPVTIFLLSMTAPVYQRISPASGHPQRGWRPRGKVICFVTEENEYGYKVNILAAEYKRHNDRYLNESLSKFIIEKWKPIEHSELPLLLGMPYISPLLEQIFRDGGL
jgi:hypothetical protein